MKNGFSDFSKLPVFDESVVFFLETLGKGGFGIVQKAYDKSRNEFIAIKRFKDVSDSSDSLEQILLEDALLQKVEQIRKIQERFNEYFLKWCF